MFGFIFGYLLGTSGKKKQSTDKIAEKLAQIERDNKITKYLETHPVSDIDIIATRKQLITELQDELMGLKGFGEYQYNGITDSTVWYFNESAYNDIKSTFNNDYEVSYIYVDRNFDKLIGI